MTLYVATGNAGKLRDFAAAAEQVRGRQIAPLPGLAAMTAPEEDQPTFAGNARLKAVYYSRLAAADSLVVADDSGLEVDALDGAPGVYSARFAALAGRAGATGSVDEENNRLLLARLDGVSNRQARYRCVLVAARAGQTVAEAEGVVEGAILREPRGTGGFGYDPLFYLPHVRATMAELDMARRLALSHRTRALEALFIALAEANCSPVNRGDGPLS